MGERGWIGEDAGVESVKCIEREPREQNSLAILMGTLAILYGILVAASLTTGLGWFGAVAMVGGLVAGSLGLIASVGIVTVAAIIIGYRMVMADRGAIATSVVVDSLIAGLLAFGGAYRVSSSGSDGNETILVSLAVLFWCHFIHGVLSALCMRPARLGRMLSLTVLVAIVGAGFVGLFVRT